MTPLRDQLQDTLGAAYTLRYELGGGGMSRVFVATETAFDRAPSVARHEDHRQREREDRGGEHRREHDDRRVGRKGQGHGTHRAPCFFTCVLFANNDGSSAMLLENGWSLVSGSEFSLDPWSYRDYILQSRGEPC